MALVALDLGARRIGLALTDEAGVAVHPLGTVERRSTQADLAAIRRALGGRAVERIVLGLPLNMDGSEGPMARHVRTFAARLHQATGIAVTFHDERLSSFEAEHRLAGNVRRGRKKAAIDAVAAVIILESWLEAHRRGRGPYGETD